MGVKSVEGVTSAQSGCKCDILNKGSGDNLEEQRKNLCIFVQHLQY